jgi:hypothetical protein
MYLDPGGVGVNQFHVIITGPSAAVDAVRPTVVASHNGGAPQLLRQLKVGPGHYTDFLVLTPGHWTLRATGTFGGTPFSVTFSRTVP